MSYYEKLMKVNIADAAQQLGLRMNYDGKIPVPYHLELESPWIEQGACPQRECLLWKDIFFDKFQVIHPGCMSCWKTYYRPTNLKDLFDVYEIQKDNPKLRIVPSCKCGIETRPYTGNLGGYGAFWYNPLGCGLEKARENTARLSELYKRELFLKRGCTEMEQFTIRAVGLDSSEWDKMIDMMRPKLQLLELTFEVDPEYRNHPRPMALRLKTEAWWIRWARDHGDETYKKYMEKENYITELRQYLGSIDNERIIDDGSIWEEYRKFGINQERVGGLDGKQEETLITSVQGT